MSKRSQEKRRARSKEKKLAKRRMLAISPMDRLVGTAEENCECWMHYAADDDRTRNIMVWRPVRGGGFAAGFFLIDLDCLGLKDAFWRADVEPSALRENMRQRSREEGTTFVKVSLREARQLVAGAMRWTLSNPFRLPAKTDQAVKVLGEPLDVDHAPIDDFGTEKGYFYFGYARDLEKALKGITLDEFLDRPDVEYEFVEAGSAGDFEEDEYDDEEEEAAPGEDDFRIFEIAEEMVQLCVAEVTRSCAAKGIKPSPLLEKVSRIHVGSILAAVAAINEGASEIKARAEAGEMLLELFEQQEESEEELIHAYEQILACSSNHGDALTHSALDRIKGKSREIIDVPLANTLLMESPCSTHDTPNLPTS